LGLRLREGLGLRLRVPGFRWRLLELVDGLAGPDDGLGVRPRPLAVAEPGPVVLEELLPHLGNAVGVLLVLAVQLLDQPGVRSEFLSGRHSLPPLKASLRRPVYTLAELGRRYPYVCGWSRKRRGRATGTYTTSSTAIARIICPFVHARSRETARTMSPRTNPTP
jgi:hypothetical protein